MPELRRSRPDWDWERLHALALRETGRCLGGSADADDAAQEAVLRAWRSSSSCMAEDPGPWVRTIARREALRLLTRRSHEPFTEDSEPTSPDDPLARQEDQLARAEDRIVLGAAARRLSPKDRELLLLRYWAGHTESEIARRLSSPVGTVKVRLHRAHKKLALALVEA